MSYYSLHRRATARVVVAAVLATSFALVAASSATAEPGFSIAWSMPSPVGSSAPPDAPYSAISCPSTTTCTAAGPFGHINLEGKPSVVTETSGQWGAAAAITLPTGGVSGTEDPAQLNDISCWSAGNCVAVGEYPTTNSGDQPLVATESSGTWGAGTTLALPTGAATGSAALSILNSVWCDASGDCVASGGYADGSGKEHVMVAQESANVWAPATALADPSTIRTASFALLINAALSCTDVADCTLVSSYVTSTFESFAYNEVASSWTAIPTSIVPPNGNGVLLLSISCPSSTECVAVGVSGSSAATAVESTGVWARAKVLALPLLTPVANQGELTSVSCASATLCVAVGVLTQPGPLTLGEAAAVTYSDGTWSTIEVVPAVRVGAGFGQDNGLVGVACPTTSSCLALGGTGISPYKTANEPLYSFWTQIAPVATITLPRAPKATKVEAVVGKATVRWAPPLTNGNSPITSFVVTATSSAEPTQSCNAAKLACTLHDLAAKHQYRVTVVAMNSKGSSIPSVPVSFVAR